LNILCFSDRCCLSEDEASKVLDVVSTLLTFLRRHSTKIDNAIHTAMRDLEAARNAMYRVVGGIRALRSRFKNLRSFDELTDVESVVNTVVNVLNRLVEVRNLIQRVRDEAESSGLSDVVQYVDSHVPMLDGVIIKASLIGLRIALNLPKVSRDDSGKLASAIGTAFFASLLSLHEDVFRKYVDGCLD